MVKVTTEISRSRKIAGAADCLVMTEMTAAFVRRTFLLTLKIENGNSQFL